MVILSKDINDEYELKLIESKIRDWIMPFFFKCLIAEPEDKLSFCLSNINFVFSLEDINEITTYLPRVDKNVLRNKLLEARNNALNVKQSSDINDKDNNVYIHVPDYKEFFYILYKIYTKSDYSFYLGLNRDNLINDIWIRMGVEDISDVMGFLKRQLEFIENERVLNEENHYGGNFFDCDNIRVHYGNEKNPEWFETNRNLTFYWSDISTDGPVDSVKFPYMLPSIHYGLAKENEELTCYIYGIQNFCDNNDWRLEKFSKDAKSQIKRFRKSFYNPYVSPDFVIAFKYFIELLQSKGITTIKVPFLQVFNYDYHTFLSEIFKDAYNSYSDAEKVKYEKMAEEGVYDREVQGYITDKIYFDRFSDKQDMISRNKIDRFIQVFMALSEKMDNIEVITEPALNGEFYIIVKINNNLDKNTIRSSNR